MPVRDFARLRLESIVSRVATVAEQLEHAQAGSDVRKWGVLRLRPRVRVRRQLIVQGNGVRCNPGGRNINASMQLFLQGSVSVDRVSIAERTRVIGPGDIALSGRKAGKTDGRNGRNMLRVAVGWFDCT